MDNRLHLSIYGFFQGLLCLQLSFGSSEQGGNMIGKQAIGIIFIEFLIKLAYIGCIDRVFEYFFHGLLQLRGSWIFCLKVYS